MGIDVYLSKKGMTEAEHKAQITGFSTTAGNVGYLREAYHGGPYATKVMFPEGFANDKNPNEGEEGDLYLGVPLTATTLKERLPQALKAVEERERGIYKGADEEVKERQQSFVNFVELAAKWEAETGAPCRVYVSW